MNKKTIVALLLMLVLFASIVIAEETTELSEDDQKDIGPINYGLGAEVRLLQLEKRITRNILVGTKVVEAIQEYNSSTDVTELDSILDEMEVLLDEVKNTKIEGTSEELAQKFVDMKSDAINLSQEFREKSKPYINAEVRVLIVNKTKNIEKDELKNISDIIKDARNDYNAYRLNLTLTALGIEDNELIEKVRNGTATVQEIKDVIKEYLKGLTSDEKKEPLMKIKEARSKRAVYGQAVKAIIISNKLQRMSNRLEIRSDKLNNWSLKLAEKGFEKRAERVEKWSELAQNRSGKLEQWSEKIKNKVQNRIRGEENE